MVPFITETRLIGDHPAPISSGFWLYTAEAKSGIYQPYSQLNVNGDEKVNWLGSHYTILRSCGIVVLWTWEENCHESCNILVNPLWWWTNTRFTPSFDGGCEGRLGLDWWVLSLLREHGLDAIFPACDGLDEGWGSIPALSTSVGVA